MQKLNRIHVSILGVLLLGGAFAAGMFLPTVGLKPRKEEIAKLEKEITDFETVIARKAQAEKNREEYKRQVGVVKEQLETYKRRFVSINYKFAGDRPAQYATMVRLWREFREDLAPAFEKFVPDVSGCEYAGLRVPAPPTQLAQVQPPASGFIRIPSSGSISLNVNGRIEDITKLLRSLHQFSRLITVGAPQVSGTSPTLNASIPIAFYVIADVPDATLKGPSASQGGGGGGGTSGGGMMSGPPEGMGGEMGGEMEGGGTANEEG